MNATLLRRNNIRTFGKGTTPMFCDQGFGCDQNMWHFISLAFQHHYQIILFNRVGSSPIIAPTFMGDYLSLHLSNSTLPSLKATEHCLRISAPGETIAATNAYLENERFYYYG